MKFTDEELVKLPKWARDKIRVTERDLEIVSDVLSRINAQTKSSIYQELGFGEEAKRQYLEERHDITFEFPKHKEFTIRKAYGGDLAYYGPHLVIYSQGGHGISVVPEVSNFIRVFARD